MDAIICMAGASRRLGAQENKVYLKLNNKMIFVYSLELLKKYACNIVLSIREEDLVYVKKYLDDRVSYVIGGSERYHSVYKAMLKVKSEKVLIHDGARPFLSVDTLKEILNAANTYDLILPYQSIKGTIYQNMPFVLLDRSNTIMATTPQLVNKDLFIASYNKAVADNFMPTDDISLILHYYPDLKVKKILDSEKNFKITTPFDLELARRLV